MQQAINRINTHVLECVLRTTNTESSKRILCIADYSCAHVGNKRPRYIRVEHEYEHENYANGGHGDVPGLFVTPSSIR